MRVARLTAVPLALAALAAWSCSTNSTGPAKNLGTVTCSGVDQSVCPPGGLTLGFNGATGSPTITPTDVSTDISVGNSAYTVGGVTSSTVNGYWLVVIGGTLRAWGVITVTAGVYAAEVPLFCGQQAIVYRFDNNSGHSFWYASATLTGCRTPAFRAQLTWDTGPLNSDIDLHLVKPAGTTNGSTTDCYYTNCTPDDTPLDWGAAGSAGNPSLDVDNTDGYGPENITLSGAERGTYRVIVRNFNGVLGTHATVKLYFNDVEKARFISDALDPISSGSNYWTVATVDIVNHVIATVSTYSSTPPAAAGVRPVSETRPKRR